MGKIKHSPIDVRFKEIRQTALDVFAGAVLDKMLTSLPVENGHAHEGLITAYDQADLPKNKHVLAAMSKHEGKASGDPEASRAGKGQVVEGKNKTSLRIKVDLPFLYKMNEGMPIYVSDKYGRLGRKRHGEKSAQPLYSPRFQSDRPTGFLMWEEGGVKKFAQVRETTKTSGFLQAAVDAAFTSTLSNSWSKI